MRLPLVLLAVLMGCESPRSSPDGGTLDAADGGGDAGPTFTWYRDVLPIVQERCQGCHRPGQVAPFALTSYAEASTYRLQIADAVTQRRMPPWPPSDHCQPLRGHPRLPPQDIEVLTGWALQEAPEGDPADAPPPPDAGVNLERIDLTLTLATPYTPPAGVADDYRCFVLNPALSSDQFIVGLDVQPGVRSMVHHAILFSVPLAEAQAKDGQTPGEGYTCFGGSGTATVELVGGWVPGMPPTRAPAGTGVRLKAGHAVVLQLHYNLAAGTSADQTSVQLMFADTSVKSAVLLPLSNSGFQIPPHVSSHSERYELTLPFGATVWGVTPHMHNLGTRMQVHKGNTCFIDIPAWDFDWQFSYFFEQPLPAFKGEKVTLDCTWRNPTSQVVTYGEGSSDEMCVAFFYLTDLSF